MKPSIERILVSAFVATLVGWIAGPALAAIAAPAAVPLAALLAGAAGWLSYRRLPAALDGIRKRRRMLAAVWTFLALVTVVQTVRLGAYMADPARDWWVTTKQELWSKHMCMTAYFYAADLERQGEPNVYDGAHYPGLNPQANVHPTVKHLSPEDPYQYPPQFLLLPRLAIALSDDFRVIRPVWYALQALFFLFIAVWLARWYGGSGGTAALWLLPLVWISVPSLLNFSYGQFHVTTIALAVAAFLAFERRRDLAGGGLLAAAILAKGFPGIVLVVLALQRRWRALAWTGTWGLGLTALALAVLGPEPFRAFLTQHLPNLSTGAAFAFEEAWPDFRAVLLAGNVSPFSMIRKLGDLGLPGMTDDLARVVQGIVSFSFLGAAVLASRLRSPRRRALGWMALLNLAAMTSPAAWGDYVPLGTLWMLSLMMAGAERARTSVLAIAGGFCFLLPGVVPIGSFPPPNAAMVLSVAATVLLIGINGWVAARGVAVPLRATDSARTAGLAAEAI
jgi:alpha-1,2-mannosyltransferase